MCMYTTILAKTPHQKSDQIEEICSNCELEVTGIEFLETPLHVVYKMIPTAPLI